VKELGVIAAKKLISESFFLIAIGSNDIVLGYLANPMAQKIYTTTQYINLMLDTYKSGIEVSFIACSLFYLQKKLIKTSYTILLIYRNHHLIA
jgi:hypothetical protein